MQEVLADREGVEGGREGVERGREERRGRGSQVMTMVM